MSEDFFMTIQEPQCKFDFFVCIHGNKFITRNEIVLASDNLENNLQSRFLNEHNFADDPNITPYIE
ncbi:hypothetical protein [Leptospira kmetyi]|uniref:hypothetical protein n=1 Tax=Leptospira kmetyi TaxID=408139 RepID=UPI0010844148|nr:hypothetical protein [Leptospira kmetyi]TGK16509.1 hypothetical protein EHO62_12315 [Leptospira kmetyi]TGK34088.1 hypothetical protein EHO66_01620 [Leptospira kmetyi]